jgi:hypothetical protein
LRVGEIDEGLTREERLAHERHGPLDSRLGPRCQPHPIAQVMSELSG